MGDHNSELNCSDENEVQCSSVTSLQSDQSNVSMHCEITKTVVWTKTVALRVDPGNDGDQVGEVGREDTGELDIVASNNIHFEHVSIKLLLYNWKIVFFLRFYISVESF